MDVYYVWFNLKNGVRDTQFAQNVHSYLGHLKEQDLLIGYRITRRKLGLAPPQLPEWNITIEFEDLAQMDRAFNRAASRADPVESLHQAVNSKVEDVFFALYREFPDSTRVTGQEKF